MFPVESKPT